MKVKVNKVNLDDIALSRKIAYKMAKILKPRFDYIVDHSPEANFFVDNNGMRLLGITFESLDYEDAIRVDEEYVMLELNNGMHQVLFEHDGFYDLLENINSEDMYDIEPEIQEYLASQREYYKDLLN